MNKQEVEVNKDNLSGATLSDANLRNADLTAANLMGANLRHANLRRTNLRHACLELSDLRNADIRYSIGNGDEVKTIQTEYYHISYTNKEMAIGCKQYTIEEWFNFSDEELNNMGLIALEFWKKWKPILKSIMEVE